MSHNPEEVLVKMQELKGLYSEIKEAIILAENFDPDNDFYITSVNELRNALDHIMRSFDYSERFENEINEAKEHMYRAGYDTYEILAINIGNKIVACVEHFDATIISLVFPTYYQDIKPKLLDIQIQLADVRAHKRLDPSTGTKSFEPYKEKVLDIIECLKVCQRITPNLNAEKRKRKFQTFKTVVLSAVITLILGVAGSWIYDTYFKKEKNSPLPAKTNEQTTPTKVPGEDSSSHKVLKST